MAYASVAHRFPIVIRAPYSSSDTTGVPSDASIRELVAVREIVHAFLTADRPQDVFQFALDRVSPLVGAAFASIYTISGDDDVMRLSASYNWPERFRPFLGDMRVRVGLGPSGQAAGERRAIYVPDCRRDGAWVAVRVMVPRAETNDVMDALYALGARAILVSSIHAARI